MYGELASVRGVIDLAPQVALDAAQGFLTRQGYTTSQRTETKITATRHATNAAGRQEDLNLTVAVDADPRGGVRIKLRGNDQEGVREHRAEWSEWAETLPRRQPAEHEPDARPAPATPIASAPAGTTAPRPPRNGPTSKRNGHPAPRPETTWQRRLTLFVVNVLLVGTLSLLFLIVGGVAGVLAGAITQRFAVGLIVGLLVGGGMVAYVWLRSVVTNEMIDIFVEDASRVWRKGRQ